MRQPWAIGLMLLIVALGVTAAQRFGWVGFMSSDDMYYYEAARGWLETPWYVPDHFGRSRTAVSLPISFSHALLGDSEFTTVLPSVLYHLGLCALTMLMLRPLVGPGTAVMATLVIGSIPIAVLYSTIPSADIAELFWTVSAFWLFYGPDTEARSKPLRALLAGMCLALAFSSRETVAAFLVFMLITFIAGKRIPRLDYIIAGAGFLMIIGIEAAYYWLAADRPLLRLELLTQALGGASDRPTAAPFSFDDTGVLRVYWLIDPFLMLLTKHNFGVIFPILLFVGFCVLRAAPQTPDAKNTPAQIIGRQALILGIVWLLFAVWSLIKMKILARYYLAPTYFLIIAATLLMVRLQWSGRRLMLLGAVLLAGNLIAIAIDNNNPKLAERAVAKAAVSEGVTIVTDPFTAYYALPYAHWAGLRPESIVGRPPRPGELYLLSERNTARPNRFVPQQELSQYQARSDWVKVRDYSDSALLPGLLADRVREIGWLPAYVKKRLTEPRGKAVLYRVGSGRE